MIRIFAKHCAKLSKLNLLFPLENCLRTFLLRTKCEVLFDPQLFTNLPVLTVMLVMLEKFTDTRINEHLTSRSSNNFQRLLKNRICKSSCNESCFTVIDSHYSRFRFTIKEALHIIKL